MREADEVAVECGAEVAQKMLAEQKGGEVVSPTVRERFSHPMFDQEVRRVASNPPTIEGR